MIEALFNPNTFFADRSGKEISLKIPLFIVLIVGIIGAATSAMMLTRIMAFLPPEAAQFSSVFLIMGVAGAFVVTLIMWVIYAGLFHLISMAFKGEGSFKRVLEFTGYGFIPSIFGGIVVLLLMWYALPSIDFSISDPQMLQKAISKNPIMMLSNLVTILFTLWSANIWIFGMKYARNLSFKNAAITVLIPIIISIVLTLYSLIS